MTGPVASIGEQMKRGADTAAAAINDAGGVEGRKIKIVIEDDACDPKQAVAIANLIVGQQIKYVDGHACSGSSIPASDVYADNSILMMSPASSNPALTEKGHPTIMRLYPRDDRQGEFIAPWIADQYKGKKIAISARQVGLWKRLGPGGEGQAERRRRDRDPVRRNQSGRKGL
jgi:branched-chain amino acid transport system substrate-binding protein